MKKRKKERAFKNEVKSVHLVFGSAAEKEKEIFYTKSTATYFKPKH